MRLPDGYGWFVDRVPPPLWGRTSASSIERRPAGAQGGSAFSFRRAIALLIVAQIAGLAGCDGSDQWPRRFEVVHEHGSVENAQSMELVIERVNRNSAVMDFLLKAGGVDAKGQYLENGKAESYDLDGTLLYRRPRDLYLQLQHSLGGKIEIGSNSEEFWVWKRLGKERYWWGRQAAVDENQELDIPLRPTDIVEMLGLGRLDVPDRDAFRVRSERYEITVKGRDVGGRNYTSKRISVDRRPPFLVREMTYYSPDGRPRVEAAVSGYTLIDGSDVRVPRRIQIRWPDKGGYLNLELGTLSRFSQRPEVVKRFTSPMQQGRQIEGTQRVDRPLTRAEGW